MKDSVISSTRTRSTDAVAPPSRSAERFRLTGPSTKWDPRITPARRDIADIALADRLFAPHYARALARTCGMSAAMLHAAPAPTAVAVSQILPGEEFYVLDISGGWAWGYCAADHYVGYVPETALVPLAADPVYIVATISALVFANADIKAPVTTILPVGSRIDGIVNGPFLALPHGGYVHCRHLAPLADIDNDPVAIACALLGMPYVWGGRGGGGIDCSGLVQLAMARCGIAAPRDSDQQRATLGIMLDDACPGRRGDIIFFPGHVGLMVDDAHLIHANAHAMAVTIDPLSEVVARIAAEHERPILVRRRLA